MHRKTPSALSSTPDTGSVTDTLTMACVAAALLGSALLIDPFAEAGFDAPKRLVVSIAAAIGGAALVMRMSGLAWQCWSRTARAVVLLLLWGTAGLVVSAIASPHPAQAWSSLRYVTLLAMFLPLGAAPALSGQSGRRLVRIAAIAIAINLTLSLLQAGGVSLPIPIARLGGRLPTGALLGNEAYVALAGALMATVSFAFALHATNPRRRWLALGLGALGLAAILVNRQLTSAIALLVAVMVLLAVHYRMRRSAFFALSLALVAIGIAVAPPLRNLAGAALPSDLETIQRITTYRVGAWAAATEMILARPLTGYGPGTFGAESQRHRLAAELRWRVRLLPPPTATTFVYAHQDYLQLAAEAGLPTLAGFLSALSLLFVGVLRRAIATRALEPLALSGLLVAGAVAALAWFPMQIPFISIVLLLVCGRAWRLVAESATGEG